MMGISFNFSNQVGIVSWAGPVYCCGCNLFVFQFVNSVKTKFEKKLFACLDTWWMQNWWMDAIPLKIPSRLSNQKVISIFVGKPPTVLIINKKYVNWINSKKSFLRKIRYFNKLVLDVLLFAIWEFLWKPSLS
jgi:hypothetical protein